MHSACSAESIGIRGIFIMAVETVVISVIALATAIAMMTAVDAFADRESNPDRAINLFSFSAAISISVAVSVATLLLHGAEPQLILGLVCVIHGVTATFSVLMSVGLEPSGPSWESGR